MAVRLLEDSLTLRRAESAYESILDAIMPKWDATRSERKVVHAPMGKVFDEVLHLDFLDIPRKHFAVRALFAVRTAMERVVSVLTFRRMPARPEPVEMRLANLPSSGEWVRLGDSRPFEFTFGAIGRFWAGETKWHATNNEVFRWFEVPGYARIACHFLLAPAPNGSTVLTYEARTQATDSVSRRAFMRYWWVVSIFVGVVMRSTLAQIKEAAEAEKEEPWR